MRKERTGEKLRREREETQENTWRRRKRKKKKKRRRRRRRRRRDGCCRTFVWIMGRVEVLRGTKKEFSYWFMTPRGIIWLAWAEVMRCRD